MVDGREETGRRDRILVVDDNPQIRQLVSIALRELRADVQGAAGGAGALERIERDPPDLVILDVMMPGLNGFEVCRRLREREETRLLPVLILTALEDKTNLVRGLESGANDFLSKPFDRIELVARVRSLLRIKHLTDRLEDAHHIIYTLAATIEARDAHTHEHIERVTLYAQALARRVGFDEGRIETLRDGALLHDVGKIGVRDGVLNKPGPLNEEEFKEMKAHTGIGDRICRPLKSLGEVALDMIRHHHERYDGKGYPDGLKGEEISVEARILAVADAYDAMTSDRPYRKGLSPREAIERLQQGAGTQWDSALVKEFVSWLSEKPSSRPAGSP
jgi:putative two-component system response regulator